MDLAVDLGPMPVDEHYGGVIEGLRGLLSSGDLTDVVLVAGGQRFRAHRCVLAAASPTFHEVLKSAAATASATATEAAAACNVPGESGGSGGVSGTAPLAVVSEANPLELVLEEVTHAEAVQAMLDCIYSTGAGEYSPSTEDANKDVLHLAQRFHIAPLLERATRWLLRGLSTSNALIRLEACEECNLTDVREQILEQLVANPDALFKLVQEPEMVKVPKVLQDMLIRILKLLGVEEMPDSKPMAVAAPAPATKAGGGKAGAAERVPGGPGRGKRAAGA